MKTLLILTALFAVAAIACAADLALPNGNVFTNYQVIRTELDGITITHSSGTAKVYFWDLSEEMQKQYKYDPQKARDYNQKARELAQRDKQKAELEAAHREVIENIKNGAIAIVGKVQQITDEGALIAEVMAPRNAKYEYQIDHDPSPPYYPFLRYKTVTAIENDYVPLIAGNEPIFVLDAGNGVTDGAPWSATVYPAGTYKYLSVQRSGKTVKCYALSPDAALQYMLKNE